MRVSESTTASYLHRSGVTGVSQQAWSKITVYTKQGFRYSSVSLSQQGAPVRRRSTRFCSFSLCSWLEKNTPHYYSECARVVGPLIERGCERVKTAAVFTSEKGVQFILWLREKSPQAVEWVTGRSA